jgi:hypothetical protein
MADETVNKLRAEIDHLRRLADSITDAQVRAEIRKMIEELEERLRELDERGPTAAISRSVEPLSGRRTPLAANLRTRSNRAASSRDRPLTS